MPGPDVSVKDVRLRAVYTLKAATEVMGVTTKEAVRRAAQRASERGLAISWDREHPDNPTDGPLYVAEWVIEYAKRNNHDGRQLPRVGVMWAELPAPVGFAPENPIALPGAAPGEAATRTASSEQQLIMAQAGERAQEIARLEAERDAARQLAELTGIENERLRSELAQVRQTMSEHLQAMARAFAGPV